MSSQQRIGIMLIGLRYSIFVVMMISALGKFVDPSGAADVFEQSYRIGHLSRWVIYVLGGLQVVVLAAFVAGLNKRLSYGLVLLMHAVSTGGAWEKYLDPWQGSNALYFGVLPMLAGCVALYALRDLDTIWAADRRRSG